MKKLTLFALILISTFAKANAVEDSLIANIGKKAKVIFYAENKADLNEIAKYDLNKLFSEVRKRSEKNFSNNEEVTLREADDLKNREVNTTISTKKWLKNMNLNLFVGLSEIFAEEGIIGKSVQVPLPNSRVGVLQDYFSLHTKNGLSLGIGGFYEKFYHKKRRIAYSLNHGYGIDFIRTQVQVFNTYYSTYYGANTIGVSDADRQVIDSLFKTKQLLKQWVENPAQAFSTTNVYYQIMPKGYLTNRKGQKTWSFGVGIKAGFSLNTIFNEIKADRFVKKIGGNGTWAGYYISTQNIEDTPNMSLKYLPIQTAITVNIGYKYINLYWQFYRNGLVLNATPRSTNNGVFLVNQRITPSNYTVGIRFGK